jgi:hypothetical protein
MDRAIAVMKGQNIQAKCKHRPLMGELETRITFIGDSTNFRECGEY